MEDEVLPENVAGNAGEVDVSKTVDNDHIASDTHEGVWPARKIKYKVHRLNQPSDNMGFMKIANSSRGDAAIDCILRRRGRGWTTSSLSSMEQNLR